MMEIGWCGSEPKAFRPVIEPSRLIMRTGDYQDVVVERDGKQHKGRYLIIHGKLPMIEVSYGDGSKTTQVGGTPPEILAKIMVRELLDKQKRAGSA